jgi:hypothetical protein
MNNKQSKPINPEIVIFIDKQYKAHKGTYPIESTPEKNIYYIDTSNYGSFKNSVFNNVILKNPKLETVIITQTLINNEYFFYYLKIFEMLENQKVVIIPNVLSQFMYESKMYYNLLINKLPQYLLPTHYINIDKNHLERYTTADIWKDKIKSTNDTILTDKKFVFIKYGFSGSSHGITKYDIQYSLGYKLKFENRNQNQKKPVIIQPGMNRNFGSHFNNTNKVGLNKFNEYRIFFKGNEFIKFVQVNDGNGLLQKTYRPQSKYHTKIVEYATQVKKDLNELLPDKLKFPSNYFCRIDIGFVEYNDKFFCFLNEIEIFSGMASILASLYNDHETYNDTKTYTDNRPFGNILNEIIKEIVSSSIPLQTPPQPLHPPQLTGDQFTDEVDDKTYDYFYDKVIETLGLTENIHVASSSYEDSALNPEHAFTFPIPEEFNNTKTNNTKTNNTKTNNAGKNNAGKTNAGNTNTKKNNNTKKINNNTEKNNTKKPNNIVKNQTNIIKNTPNSNQTQTQNKSIGGGGGCKCRNKKRTKKRKRKKKRNQQK